jgi:hypothetical protein
MFPATTLESIMQLWAAESRKVSIKSTIEKSGRGWILSIFEDFSSVDDAGNSFPSSDLKEQVDWATEQLEGQAVRLAWNMWKFKNKRDAEKFTTVYYLIWAK